MDTSLIGLIGLLAIVITLLLWQLFTKPKKERHLRKIFSEMTKRRGGTICGGHHNMPSYQLNHRDTALDVIVHDRKPKQTGMPSIKDRSVTIVTIRLVHPSPHKINVIGRTTKNLPKEIEKLMSRSTSHTVDTGNPSFSQNVYVRSDKRDFAMHLLAEEIQDRLVDLSKEYGLFQLYIIKREFTCCVGGIPRSPLALDRLIALELSIYDRLTCYNDKKKVA